MTKEDVIKKYGDVKLLFIDYWNHYITYAGIASDNAYIEVGVNVRYDNINSNILTNVETINSLKTNYIVITKPSYIHPQGVVYKLIFEEE